MEHSGTRAHGGGEAESRWFDGVAALALDAWRQAAAYLSPDELDLVAEAVDEEAGQEQVVEQSASWALLPVELRELILSQLPLADLRDVVKQVSHEMAALAQGVYQREYQPREEAVWQQAWTDWGSDPTVRFATTQEQLDFSLAEPNVAGVCVRADPSQELRLSGSRTAVVKVYGSSRINVRGEGQVEIYDNVRAAVSQEMDEQDNGFFAHDDTQVDASGYIQVYAKGSAVVVASGHARITADDGATVTASGDAHVDAYGSVVVIASGDARVYTHGENTVRASGRVSIAAQPWTRIIPSNWPDVTWLTTRWQGREDY